MKGDIKGLLKWLFVIIGGVILIFVIIKVFQGSLKTVKTYLDIMLNSLVPALKGGLNG